MPATAPWIRPRPAPTGRSAGLPRPFRGSVLSPMASATPRPSRRSEPPPASRAWWGSRAWARRHPVRSRASRISPDLIGTAGSATPRSTRRPARPPRSPSRSWTARFRCWWRWPLHTTPRTRWPPRAHCCARRSARMPRAATRGILLPPGARITAGSPANSTVSTATSRGARWTPRRTATRTPPCGTPTSTSTSWSSLGASSGMRRIAWSRTISW